MRRFIKRNVKKYRNSTKLKMLAPRNKPIIPPIDTETKYVEKEYQRQDFKNDCNQQLYRLYPNCLEQLAFDIVE